MAAAKKRVFRTKKVLSGIRSEYRAWKEWDDGDVIVCKLTGTSPNRKNKAKVDWIVEPVEVFFSNKKEQKRIAGAKLVTLNTAGQLDKGMEKIAEGTLVQITYNGSVEMTGGEYEGGMAHTMEVVEVEEESDEDIDADDSDEDTDEESDEDDL